MEENEYICPACGQTWTGEDKEHCPNCLSAIHEEEGEDFECGGRLEPVSVWVKPDGEWEILQRCVLCGEIHSSPLSGEDNPVTVMSVAARPLASPPFPIEKLKQLAKLTGAGGDMGGYYHEQGE